MKLKVKKTYRVRVGRDVIAVEPGVYQVPQELSQERAKRILSLRLGEKIEDTQKKAPENKVLAGAPESKAKVGKVRGRRSRPKSDG